VLAKAEDALLKAVLRWADAEELRRVLLGQPGVLLAADRARQEMESLLLLVTAYRRAAARFTAAMS